MRKLIAAINMTLDGFCDHTAAIVDEEIHQHYTDLLNRAGLLLYGRITYQLMESFWPNLVENPSGQKDLDDFAVAIDHIPKIVYSRTLQHVDWKSATLKHELIREEIAELKQQPGSPIFAGSPSMIVALSNLGLIDEYQIAIHPVILGRGLPLFKNITDKINLKFQGTKSFNAGVEVLYYERIN